MSIAWPLFLSIFSFIFLAELPDKTAFATLMLATRSKPVAVFLGVALAFVVQGLVAILLGGVIGLLPERYVHLLAGLMFLGFAWHSWFHRDEEEAEESAMVTADSDISNNTATANAFRSTFIKSFTVIFIAEWGDITQLATATFAARYHHDLLTVFLAATLALWSVTALAVVLGQHLKRIVHVDLLKKIGTAVFIMVGLYFLYAAFQAALL